MCYSEILDQLDEAAKSYNFPIFNNVNYRVAAMRISTFCELAEWLIVFETIDYEVSEKKFNSNVTAFGNEVLKPGFQSDIEIICLPSEYSSEDINALFKSGKIKFFLRNEEIELEFGKPELEETKIELDPKMPPLLKVLRLITSLIPEKVFSKNEQLLARCNRQNLAGFLTLKEWHHPKLIGSQKELPSQNKCFQNLALALSSRDKSLYQCQEMINSYWYFWDIPG